MIRNSMYDYYVFRFNQTNQFSCNIFRRFIITKMIFNQTDRQPSIFLESITSFLEIKIYNVLKKFINQVFRSNNKVDLYSDNSGMFQQLVLLVCNKVNCLLSYQDG